MPKIRLIDSEVRKLPHGPTTWYSELRPNMHAGLRLCVGRSMKTWYASKRNPHTSKVLSVKLGRFPALSATAAWTRCEMATSRIDNGNHDVALPTFQEMFDRYIVRQRRADDVSAETERDYRATVRLYLSPWVDKPLDKIPAIELTDHLDRVRDVSPYSATKAATLVGAVFKLADQFNLPVRNPAATFQLEKPRKRFIDEGVPWATRLAEIEAVENVIKRTAWMLLWHTGIRSGNLRALTWPNVDLDAKTVTLVRMKNKLSRTLPLSDVSVGLFERLRALNLHSTLVFPGRGGVRIDQLDRIASTTQHELRHLWTTAAGLCHLPGYVIAHLKGDVVAVEGQPMVAHYMGDVGDHAAVNAISAKILEKCRT